MHLENASVTQHRPVAGAYRELSFETTRIARETRPGQFVHIRVPNLGESVLRRPFSIYRADGAVISILYKEVGKGTRALARLARGDTLSALGPLGNGFPTPADGALPVLVAGGYGVAALYLLAERARSKGVLFVGGSGRQDLLCAGDFEKLGWQVVAATEDGSQGFKGRVTGALDEWVKSGLGNRTPEFFVCGPMGLLRAMADRAKALNVRAWLSMDRHMGCGVGACLACVQRIRLPSPPGAWKWARICRDGPVFEAGDILWDDREDG
ncbi:MAG: dihydroorotate dehydrogenase electron transfer subunit [Lentisphaerae bacterium]|nr:dihydroorotate dehydrogenase electron transfer subunit [Lentisphaerota bacterium]